MTRVYQTQTGSFTAGHSHQGVLNEGFHTHHFTYEVTFYGPLNEEGFLLDFRPVAQLLRMEIDQRLEGADLSLLLKNPTTEQLAIWIYNHIQPRLPHLFSVKVAEEPDRWIVYQGEK